MAELAYLTKICISVFLNLHHSVSYLFRLTTLTTFFIHKKNGRGRDSFCLRARALSAIREGGSPYGCKEANNKISTTTR